MNKLNSAAFVHYMPAEVYNTRSLHLGNGVANMSFTSNLFLDCLDHYDQMNRLTYSG